MKYLLILLCFIQVAFATYDPTIKPNIQKNYIESTNGSNIGRWVTYADAAQTIPVDGTGGAPSSTFAVSTDSTMRGTTNFLWTHSAANRQGEGFSYDFTIDPSDKGKVLQISLEYLIASGTFADNNLSFWIYDVTNAVLIQPAPYLLKNSGIIEKFALEFQTSTSTSYRLIAHVDTATATAYTIRFTNFSLGPQAKLYGSADTDWVAYTPTFTGFGTIAAQVFFYKKAGDSLYIKGTFTSGTPTAVQAKMTLPVSAVLDSYIGLSTSGAYYKGDAAVVHGGPILLTSGLSYIQFSDPSAFGAISVSAQSPANGSAVCNAGEIVKVETGPIKITGWSSSQVMSSDAATTVVAWQGYTSSTQTFSAATQITSFTTVKDDVGGFSSNAYTVKVPGRYRISGALLFGTQATANTLGYCMVYKNGAPLANGTKISLNSAINTTSVFSNAFDFVAGDIITIYGAAGLLTSLAGITADQTWSIERISGPSQIMASAIVSFSANTSTTAATTSTPFIYTVKDHDTHNAYSTSTGKFTAPISGNYHFSEYSYTGATASFGVFYKNGIAVAQGSISTSNTTSGTGSFEIAMLTGDTMEVRPSASLTASGGATTNIFSGFRIGGI